MEFWEKFLNCAINKGVGEHAKWYVNWGVRFARSIRGVPLKERSLEDVRLFHMESWSSESQMHTNKKQISTPATGKVELIILWGRTVYTC